MNFTLEKGSLSYIPWNTSEHRYRYQCKDRKRYYDDLTNAPYFQGHHQLLKVWGICLYLMGLNLSNGQIYKELGIDKSDCHSMTSLLREGVYEKKSEVQLEGTHNAVHYLAQLRDGLQKK